MITLLQHQRRDDLSSTTHGNSTGYEDVFTKIEMCRRHYARAASARLRRPVHPLSEPSISLTPTPGDIDDPPTPPLRRNAAVPRGGRALAQAADYPTKPVNWVVPYPPAGTTDVLARIIAQWLSEKMGQQFVIENKPGAGNNIGVESVVNAPPDGYTMLLVNPANGINATLYKNLSFNFIRDIAPVAGLVRTPNVMEVTTIVAGEDRAGVHRLLQGQPGQDQHGVVRQRHLGAPVGRAVQVDDRLRHAPRAVQGRRARRSPT